MNPFQTPYPPPQFSMDQVYGVPSSASASRPFYGGPYYGGPTPAPGTGAPYTTPPQPLDLRQPGSPYMGMGGPSPAGGGVMFPPPSGPIYGGPYPGGPYGGGPAPFDPGMGAGKGFGEQYGVGGGVGGGSSMGADGGGPMMPLGTDLATTFDSSGYQPMNPTIGGSGPIYGGGPSGGGVQWFPKPGDGGPQVSPPLPAPGSRRPPWFTHPKDGGPQMGPGVKNPYGPPAIRRKPKRGGVVSQPQNQSPSPLTGNRG